MCVSILKKRQEHQTEIKKHVPVLYVVKIMNNSLGQIGVATKTVYLSPAGDAGFHGMASIVMRDFVLKIADQLRALWARPD